MNNVFHNNKSVAEVLKVKKTLQTLDVTKKENVDINKLLNRVKVEKLNEKKKKLIFFSLGILLIIFMGIFLLIIK
jgi:hypothetical protein